MSTIDKDSKDCALYVCNGVIIDYVEAGHTPTLAEVRENWHMRKCNDKVTDDEINKLIAAQAKIQRMKDYFKSQHEYLVVHGTESNCWRSVEAMTEQEAAERLQELKRKYPIANVTRVNW